MAQYNLGQVAVLSAVFEDAATEEAADPTTVTCTVIAPDGTETTYTYGTDAQLLKDSTGHYHLDQYCTLPDTWYYQFKGDGDAGTLRAADETNFTVKRSRFS